MTYISLGDFDDVVMPTSYDHNGSSSQLTLNKLQYYKDIIEQFCPTAREYKLIWKSEDASYEGSHKQDEIKPGYYRTTPAKPIATLHTLYYTPLKPRRAFYKHLNTSIKDGNINNV